MKRHGLIPVKNMEKWGRIWWQVHDDRYLTGILSWLATTVILCKQSNDCYITLRHGLSVAKCELAINCARDYVREGRWRVRRSGRGGGGSRICWDLWGFRVLGVVRTRRAVCGSQGCGNYHFIEKWHWVYLAILYNQIPDKKSFLWDLIKVWGECSGDGCVYRMAIA